MTRILVVDDEQDLVWAVRRSLNDEGWEVLTAFDGQQAIAIAQTHQVDLILLDIVMPELDGLEVCRRLRQDPRMAAVPILFATVRREIDDLVTGLNEGADDYIAKPFDLKELKARVSALLRRGRLAANAGAEPINQNLLVAGPLTLDLNTRQVQLGEKAIQLTHAEFDLVRYLMTHPGQILSSAHLLQQVWGYSLDAADPALVRWHMKNLRAKIESDPACPLYIRTVSHQGYIFERRGSPRSHSHPNLPSH
jgi:DNA-binding response OmpR family regulator